MLVGEKNSGNIADKSAAADKSEKIINNVLSREISEAAARELNDFQQIQLSSAELIIDADYQHRTKTIEYEYLDGRNRTRDPRGLIEHIQHFFGKEFTEYSVRTKICGIRSQRMKKLLMNWIGCLWNCTGEWQ